MGKNRDGTHPGETNHGEGQHGNKTHKAFLEQLQSGSRDEDSAGMPTPQSTGGHRLAENREQHDEADRNSEANRKRVEVERGNLDREMPGVGDRINGDSGHH